MLRSWSRSSWLLQQLQCAFSRTQIGKSGGAEKDYGVLNALAAKTGQGLGVFSQNAEGPSVGTVQECGIFVSQRSLGKDRFIVLWHRDRGLPKSSRLQDYRMSHGGNSDL